MKFTAQIRDKAGRVLYQTPGAYATREEAARLVFSMAPRSQDVCSTFYGVGMDVRWHRRHEVGEITAAGVQNVIPGADREGSACIAKQRAAGPLKPNKPQAACDLGLFSDARNQRELF